ncbi:MAG: ECF transporter S component [Ruminococcaceae bacterium]|nr:ECF transporter S component [Oscillospiraceae bacterium]
MNKTKLRRLTLAAMMGTIAFILIFINFGVPFLSPVAEFDLSALPELIGGFILGPVGAVMIIVVKLGLKLAIQGTESMFTGEIQNFLLSVAYVLPAVLYYRRHRTKKGAAVGLAIGAVISVVAAVFTNLYIIFPFYIKLYGMNWDGIVAMFSAVNPWIKNIPTMVAFSVVPFNLISRTITAVLAFFTYKKLSVPLKKMIQ